MEKLGHCSRLVEDDGGSGGRKEVVWSEAAVWTLVNAYEDKWRQVEWGSLKARHWEEVAAALSAGHWSPKSPVQCKNKIEDLKKKFKDKIQRGSGGGSSSSSSSCKWPYFARMEAMFKNAARGGGATSSIEGAAVCLPAFPDRPHAIFAHNLRVGGVPPAHGFLDEVKEREEKLEDDECRGDESDEDDEGGGDEEDDEDEEQELCFEPSVVGSKRKAEQQQPRIAEEMSGKSSKKRSDSCSMKDALVTLVSSLGESLVRIERAKLEVQRQLVMMRAQAENRRIEMEMQTSEMFNSIQLQLAELISQTTSVSTNRSTT